MIASRSQAAPSAPDRTTAIPPTESCQEGNIRQPSDNEFRSFRPRAGIPPLTWRPASGPLSPEPDSFTFVAGNQWVRLACSGGSFGLLEASISGLRWIYFHGRYVLDDTDGFPRQTEEQPSSTSLKSPGATSASELSTSRHPIQRGRAHPFTNMVDG